MMKRQGVSNGYAKLAARIIESGEQAYDKSFLESEWCDDLREMVKLDNELHSGIKAKSYLTGGGGKHDLSDQGRT